MFERFTVAAREVVKQSVTEAREMKHRKVGTEHLLLALVRDETGIAANILHDAGIEPQRVRAETITLVGSGTDVFSGADAEALRSIGIDLDAIRSKVEETFGEGALESPQWEEVQRRGLFSRREQSSTFGPRARKVLELSLREAIHLRHKEIGAEHILLGLLREGDGLAAKILTNAGLNLEDLRTHVLDTLNRAR